MTRIELDDARLVSAGLLVEVVGPREARILDAVNGDAELTRVAVRDGALAFFPDRVSSQKRVLARLGVEAL